MVDLVDIGFSINTAQIKTAKQELAELGNSFNSATKSASIFEQAFARAAAQSAKDAKFLRDTVRANQELINTNLGVSNSYKSAKDSASAFGVVLSNIDRASKAFTANFNNLVGVTKSSATSGGAGFGAIENEVERLRLKYNQIYASSQLYERSLVELSQAHMLGVVSTKQHEAAVESLNMEYQNFQSGIAQAGNRFAQYSSQSASGMNKFGVAAQQTGYQVSDFLVQVQGGTNPLVAFSQQATQLAGLLYLLPPSLQAARIGITGFSVSLATATAGLTIIIPILAMLAMSFFSSSKASKEAADQIKSNMDSLQSTIDQMHLDNIKVGFKIDEDSVARVKEDMIKANMELLELQASIPPPQAGGFVGAIQAKNAMAEQARILKEQLAGQQELLDKLDAEKEARRMLAGQGSAAVAVQRELVANKAEELRLAREREKAEQAAADKATFLKNVFHIMAGEAGAVSIELGGWAGAIIAATNASSGLKDFLLKMRIDTGMKGRGLPADYYGMDTAPIDLSKTFGNIEFGATGAAIKPEDKKETGGGGGIDKVQALLDSLQTQKEVVDLWYEESQVTLQSASDKELAIIGGRHEAELRLETEHQQRMAGIKEAVKQNNLSVVLGSGAQVLAALGAHNEKAAKMAKIFGAAQALADTYVGAAAALKLPFPANLAAAASIISAGLGFVAAIRSGGTASAKGGSISGGSPASVGTTATAAPATPLSVMIQGIKPTDIFTGEQLSTLFDSLYKENRNRGMVFQVAR